MPGVTWGEAKLNQMKGGRWCMADRKTQQTSLSGMESRSAHSFTATSDVTFRGVEIIPALCVVLNVWSLHLTKTRTHISGISGRDPAKSNVTEQEAAFSVFFTGKELVLLTWVWPEAGCRSFVRLHASLENKKYYITKSGTPQDRKSRKTATN